MAVNASRSTWWRSRPISATAASPYLLVSRSNPGADGGIAERCESLSLRTTTMTPIAPHITAYLQQRLPVERNASDYTCDSYAYAFKLLFEYASDRLKVAPSELNLEQLDAPLDTYVPKSSGNHTRQRTKLKKHPPCCHQVFHALHVLSRTLGREWNKFSAFWQFRPRKPNRG